MFDFLRKRRAPRKARRPGWQARAKRVPAQVSTKEDVQLILKEIASSRRAVIREIHAIPGSEELAGVMAAQITSPLKEFLQEKLSSNQAVKQEVSQVLSSNQAVKSLDELVADMRQKMDMLTPRHLRVLGVLAQKRDEWLGYGDIGGLCTPPLSGSCVRGYVADLINMYRIPIEKKSFGKQSRIRVSEKVLRQLALSRLAD